MRSRANSKLDGIKLVTAEETPTGISRFVALEDDLLNRLGSALRRPEFEQPFAEDLADVLYLAAVLSATSSASAGETRRLVGSDDLPSNRAEAPSGGKEAADHDGRPEAPSPRRQGKLFTRPGEASTGRDTQQEQEQVGRLSAIPLRTPGVRALPDSLTYMRALRSFKRRQSSRTALQLNETETTRIAADTDGALWLPVMKPEMDRWFDVVFVLDTAISMSVWQELLEEFLRVFERLSAFRDVRVYHMDSRRVPVQEGSKQTGSELPLLYAVSGRERIGAASLLAPGTARMVFVVSDCTGPAWRDGRVASLLRVWNRQHHTAILQTLPEPLWVQTALALGERTIITASVQSMEVLVTGCPSYRHSRLSGVADLIVPVVELTPISLADYSRFVTCGGNEAPVVGYALSTRSLVETQLASNPYRGVSGRGRAEDASVLARRRWDRARANVSPLAWKLLRLFAAAPLRLPIMRLVQRLLLPDAGPLHLSEALLSGLLKRVEPGQDRLSKLFSGEAAEPDRIAFEFHEGVRKLLLGEEAVIEEVEVVHLVSRYISERLHVPVFDFPSLLALPASAADPGSRIASLRSLEEQSSSFAEIAPLILRRLGGVYAEVADQLEQADLDRWHLEDPLAERNAVAKRKLSLLGIELIPIPAGEFPMGDEDQSDNPRYTVYLDDYSISQNPITVKQYLDFCSATWREVPKAPDFNSRWGKQDHPIVNISWDDAMAFCAWLTEDVGVKITLPTEAQWEKAARGVKGNKYPWGNRWSGKKCANSVGNSDLNGTVAVGSYPTGASPYGVMDMAGNVWEWCSDWYDDSYITAVTSRNPTGPASGTYRVLRGGSWDDVDQNGFRCAYRDGTQPGDWDNFVGFRCVAPGLSG